VSSGSSASSEPCWEDVSGGESSLGGDSSDSYRVDEEPPLEDNSSDSSEVVEESSLGGDSSDSYRVDEEPSLEDDSSDSSEVVEESSLGGD